MDEQELSLTERLAAFEKERAARHSEPSETGAPTAGEGDVNIEATQEDHNSKRTDVPVSNDAQSNTLQTSSAVDLQKREAEVNGLQTDEDASFVGTSEHPWRKYIPQLDQLPLPGDEKKRHDGLF